MNYPNPYVAPGLPQYSIEEKMNAVLDAVCLVHGVERETMFNGDRATKRIVSIPKQDAYWLMKTYAKARSPRIAKYFNLQASTIRHGWCLVEFDIKHNKETAERIERIKNSISLYRSNQK